MIAAFTGWNDAGSAASSAAEHLIRTWNAVQYAELDPEEYQDYQVNRPTVTRNDAGRRVINWPATRIWIARLPHRTFVIVDGVEPSSRWRRFCEEILDIAADLKVETVITIGALLADAPHTRPLPANITSDDHSVRTALGLELSDYEGPTGIVGVLQVAATNAGFDALSVWVAVPHYFAEPPSPKATLTLLTSLEEIIDDTIDLGDYPEAANEWLETVKELVEDDEHMMEYISHLEQATDTVESPGASGDAIVSDFETWLKGQ
jgi:proteasome assembly chaperone (PAC2) family protein